jgi:prepilin-type N-terminal cleavage/methylation domain-containing protein
MPLRLKSRIQSNNRGFTMVELLAAVVIFNLLLAGLVKLFVGQNSMVESLEGWAEGEPVLYVRQESDPMVRALGVPATLITKRIRSAQSNHDEKSEYVVEILKVERKVSEESATVLFLQTKEEENDDKGKDNKDNKNDKNDKHKESKRNKKEDRE